MQSPLHSNKTSHPGSHNFLCYNHAGKVILRSVSYNNKNSTTFIDVEYSLSNLSKLMIPNTLNFTMADLSYSGVLLASPGVELTLDEYLDEEADQDS
jgi:hypothetical protein